MLYRFLFNARLEKEIANCELVVSFTVGEVYNGFISVILVQMLHHTHVQEPLTLRPFCQAQGGTV